MLPLHERQALLDAGEIVLGLQVEVLDPTLDVVINDIADRVTALVVEHRSYADSIHRTVRMTCDRALDWGYHRVRPWVTVTGNGRTDTQAVGTFALTATPQPRAPSLPTYDVDGYDLLYLMDQPVDRGWTAPRDRSYLDSVKALCTQQGLGVDIPPGSTETPPTPRSWTITDDTTWLAIANELLAAVGFQALAMTPGGRAYSERYVEPAQRRVALHYDATTAGSSVEAVDGVLTHEYTDAPNRWVAYRTDPELGPPRVGAGIAVIDNVSTGPASQQSRGMVIPRLEQVDAVDQAALEDAARMMRDVDGDSPRTLTLATKPHPWHGHLDVVTVLDPPSGVNGRMSQVGWTLDVLAGELTHELREVTP